MRKVIRLTENDLLRLVKKIVKEDKGPFATHDLVGGWYNAEDRNVPEPTDYSEEREFGPDEYEDFMEFINNCNTRWCLTTKKYYDTYAQRGKIKVRK